MSSNTAAKTATKSVLGKHIFEKTPTHKRLENPLTMDNKATYRSVQSGPSSLESGKASSMFTTSGPSSIDSGKVSFSKTSGHSSLESQISTNTMQQHGSPSRSILVLNGSPRGTPRHQAMKARAEQNQRNRSSTPSRILEEITSQRGTNTRMPGKTQSISTSNSNNSITLQVTTSNGSQSSIPSTKIFVQNSPVRSVITLENGKLMENSNVFIINNETTTNEKGEIIRKTLSKQHHPAPSAAAAAQMKKENSISENDANSETCDSISFISETSPDPGEEIDELNCKFTKNINNDATMNNSRKLCLQLPQNGSSNIVYKNVLKNDSSHPTSPTEGAATASKQDFEIAGSVGNLRCCFDKNTKGSQNKLNSNCDLKNLRFESAGNLNLQKGANLLNSNPAINSDSLAHILHKNIIAVGSEPNLAVKNCDQRLKGNCDKSIEKESLLDRRFSLSKESTAEELYNFPSLTDLSFNFTSLAAQKILQGVSLNSIDTLVELNMAANNKEKQKQQNNQPTPVSCTDYGMV